MSSFISALALIFLFAGGMKLVLVGWRRGASIGDRGQSGRGMMAGILR